MFSNYVLTKDLHNINTFGPFLRPEISIKNSIAGSWLLPIVNQDFQLDVSSRLTVMRLVSSRVASCKSWHLLVYYRSPAALREAVRSRRNSLFDKMVTIVILQAMQ